MQLPANGPLTQAQGQPVKPVGGHGRQPVAPGEGGVPGQKVAAGAVSQTSREVQRQNVNATEFDRNAPRGTYLNIIV